MALKYKSHELSHYKGNNREDYASLDGSHLAGSLFGNNLSNGNVYDKNLVKAREYISGQKITPELIENSNIANKVAKEDRENAIYVAGKVKVPFSDYITGKGNDYDVHVGIQGNLLSVGGGYGTDGVGVNVDAVPNVGLGLYVNAIPKDEKPISSVIWGVKNALSYNGIVTTKGNVGHGLTLGIALPTISPINTSIHIPIDQIDAKK